jgi:LysR family carnitine catabolism transcriptional activator
MNISPKQLRMFLALSESLNFSKTAEQLFMTQPSLSKTIKDLEDELKLTLFERSTRSVRLTASGARMAKLARSILGEFDAGLQRMHSTAEHEAMQLSVACWPSLANTLLPEVCVAMEQRFHSPKISIYDCTNIACIQRIQNHEVDFAIASISPSHPDLHYEELLRDRFVLLASGVWRKRIRQKMALKELLNLPVITLSDSSTAMRYMSAAFLQLGIEYQPKMQVDQISTVAGLVKKEVGVAVLPYLGALPMLNMRGIETTEIAGGPLRSVGIVTRRQSTPNAIALEAMKAVVTASRELMLKHSGWVLSPSAGK